MLTTSLLAATFLLFLIVSGIFSMTETAIISINRLRLRRLTQSKNPAAVRLSQLLSNPLQLLSVLLLCNNFANVTCASVATLFFVSIWGQHEFVITFSSLLVTLVILIFAEITPKILGLHYNERIALFAARPLSSLIRLMLPIVGMTNVFVNGILWVLGKKNLYTSYSYNISVAELRTMILDLPPSETKQHWDIIKSVISLEETLVGDIMVNKNQIVGIDIAQAPAELLPQLRAAQFHVLPVYRKHLDEILGTVRTVQLYKNLLRHQDREITEKDILPLLDSPHFVPKQAKIFKLLADFQSGYKRIFFVVDDYGKIIGMVTPTDFMEAVFGRVFSDNSHAIIREPDGSWIINAQTPMRVIQTETGLYFGETGANTLNGLIQEHLGDIPETPCCLAINDIRIEILHTGKNIIHSVRILAQPPAS